jgi:putative transposase
MLVYEFKAYGTSQQFNLVDEAIRTVQFVRNKCLRLWIDGGAKNGYDLNKYCATLANEFSFAKNLNSQARQAAAERAWAAINHFFDNCKKKISGKKDFHLSKKTIVQLNTRLLAGNWLMIANPSLSPMGLALVGSR